MMIISCLELNASFFGFAGKILQRGDCRPIICRLILYRLAGKKRDCRGKRQEDDDDEENELPQNDDANTK